MHLRKNTLAELFVRLAQPDKDGFADAVYKDRFVGEFAELKLGGNGGSWSRDDGRLGKIFNIRRIKDKNRIVAIELHGWNKNAINKSIPQNIRDKIGKRCVVLATGKPEVDHKDGRRDVPGTEKKDFQPLSKAANNAKRQHCKECRRTNKRFDAKLLGYSVGQVKGNGVYEGSCVGCYWYDPFVFNQEVSKNLRGK